MWLSLRKVKVKGWVRVRVRFRVECKYTHESVHRVKVRGRASGTLFTYLRPLSPK